MVLRDSVIWERYFERTLATADAAFFSKTLGLFRKGKFLSRNSGEYQMTLPARHTAGYCSGIGRGGEGRGRVGGEEVKERLG